MRGNVHPPRAALLNGSADKPGGGYWGTFSDGRQAHRRAFPGAIRRAAGPALLRVTNGKTFEGTVEAAQDFHSHCPSDSSSPWQSAEVVVPKWDAAICGAICSHVYFTLSFTYMENYDM